MVSNQYIALQLFCCETNTKRRLYSVVGLPLFCCETNTLRCLYSVVKPIHCVLWNQYIASPLFCCETNTLRCLCSVVKPQQNKGNAMYWFHNRIKAYCNAYSVVKQYIALPLFWLWNQYIALQLFWLWNQYIASPLFCCETIHCVAFVLLWNQYIASPLFCCETNTLRCLCSVVKPIHCVAFILFETNTLRCLCSVVKPNIASPLFCCETKGDALQCIGCETNTLRCLYSDCDNRTLRRLYSVVKPIHCVAFILLWNRINCVAMYWNHNRTKYSTQCIVSQPIHCVAILLWNQYCCLCSVVKQNKGDAMYCCETRYIALRNTLYLFCCETNTLRRRNVLVSQQKPKALRNVLVWQPIKAFIRNTLYWFHNRTKASQCIGFTIHCVAFVLLWNQYIASPLFCCETTTEQRQRNVLPLFCCDNQNKGVAMFVSNQYRRRLYSVVKPIHCVAFILLWNQYIASPCIGFTTE